MEDLIEESVADELRIYELERERGILELGKEVEKSHEINKARLRGGDKEVEKIDEEYDVKMS